MRMNRYHGERIRLRIYWPDSWWADLDKDNPLDPDINHRLTWAAARRYINWLVPTDDWLWG